MLHGTCTHTHTRTYHRNKHVHQPCPCFTINANYVLNQRLQNKRATVRGWKERKLTVKNCPPSWKSVAQSSKFFLKKPFGLCVTTLVWYLCLCLRLWIDVTAHWVKCNMNHKKEPPPWPEPSHAAAPRTSSHALLESCLHVRACWQSSIHPAHFSWVMPASLTRTDAAHFTHQFPKLSTSSQYLEKKAKFKRTFFQYHVELSSGKSEQKTKTYKNTWDAVSFSNLSASQVCVKCHVKKTKKTKKQISVGLH